MLKNQFKDLLEFNIYKEEQKVRREKGYLTKSEREILKKMLEKDYKPVFIEEKYKGKKLITNIKALKFSCLEVRKDEDVSHIIKDLKEAHAHYGGIGISANQIGYNRKISYIKVPKTIDQQTKKIEYSEYVFINAEIISKNTPIKVNNEGCISFPGIEVTTKRYAFVAVHFENENRKETTGMFSDLESLVVQHETDHQNSTVIFDRKWKT